MPISPLYQTFWYNVIVLEQYREDEYLRTGVMKFIRQALLFLLNSTLASAPAKPFHFDITTLHCLFPKCKSIQILLI